MNFEKNSITPEDIQNAGKALRAIVVLFVKTLANAALEAERRTADIDAVSVNPPALTIAEIDVVKGEDDLAAAEQKLQEYEERLRWIDSDDWFST